MSLSYHFVLSTNCEERWCDWLIHLHVSIIYIISLLLYDFGNTQIYINIQCIYNKRVKTTKIYNITIIYIG